MTKLTKSTKFDENKPEHHLIPSLALEEISKAMTFGANKYDAYNWSEGECIKWSRYFNACLRHLWKFWRGTQHDEESEIHHVAHAGACILILLEMCLLPKGKDDRPIYYKETVSNKNNRM